MCADIQKHPAASSTQFSSPLLIYDHHQKGNTTIRRRGESYLLLLVGVWMLLLLLLREWPQGPSKPLPPHHHLRVAIVIVDLFVSRLDPYGNKWPSGKKRGRPRGRRRWITSRPQLLQKSRHLQGLQTNIKIRKRERERTWLR